MKARLVRRDYVFDLPSGRGGRFLRFVLWTDPPGVLSLDEAARGRLRHELVDLWSSANLAGDDATVVKSEYLEVIGQRS